MISWHRNVLLQGMGTAGGLEGASAACSNGQFWILELLRPSYPLLTPTISGRFLPKKRQGSAVFLFPVYFTQSIFYKVQLSIPETLREELWISQRDNLLAGCPSTQPIPSQQRGGQWPTKGPVSRTAGKQVSGILFPALKERTVLSRIAKHIQNSRALPRFKSVVLEVSKKCRSSFQLTLLNFEFYYEKSGEATS